jgi:hypothetical protein
MASMQLQLKKSDQKKLKEQKKKHQRDGDATVMATMQRQLLKSELGRIDASETVQKGVAAADIGSSSMLSGLKTQLRKSAKEVAIRKAKEPVVLKAKPLRLGHEAKTPPAVVSEEDVKETAANVPAILAVAHEAVPTLSSKETDGFILFTSEKLDCINLEDALKALKL